MSGFTVILDMNVPGYTNKKGVVTPATTVKAHYVKTGQYKMKFLGRVSQLGNKPIPWPPCRPIDSLISHPLRPALLTPSFLTRVLVHDVRF